MTDIAQVDLDTPTKIKTPTFIEVEEQKPFPLSVNDIHSFDRTSLIQNLVKALDERAIPSSETAQALISRTFETEENAPWTPRQLKPIEKYGKNSEQPVPKGASKTFPNGLMDIDDADALTTVTFATLSKLSPEEKIAALQSLISLFDGIDPLDRLDFFSKTLNFVRDADNKAELFSLVADYLYQNREKVHFSPYAFDSATYVESATDSLVFELSLFNQDIYFDYLTSLEDEEKLKYFLGLFISRRRYPDALNLVRKKTKDGPIPSAIGQRFEKIGRLLLGLNPENPQIPFHLNLQSVYGSLKFENYPPNLAVNDYEIDLLKKIIKKESRTQGLIVDLGTGTGRIANALKEGGIEQQIIGIDITQTNLTKAKEQDKSHQVSYVLADWKNVPLTDNSVSFVFSLGRSLCHCENETAFADLIREITRILKSGSLFVFDLPDPNKGEYLENRKKYIELLKSLSVPTGNEEEALRNVKYVVDSADGKNFYNRLTPSLEETKDLFEHLGFIVEMLGRQSIFGSNGSETVYFKATKI